MFRARSANVAFGSTPALQSSIQQSGGGSSSTMRHRDSGRGERKRCRINPRRPVGERRTEGLDRRPAGQGRGREQRVVRNRHRESNTMGVPAVAARGYSALVREATGSRLHPDILAQAERADAWGLCETALRLPGLNARPIRHKEQKEPRRPAMGPVVHLRPSVIAPHCPHPAAYGRHPLPQAGEGNVGAEDPFSRLREKVAARSAAG